MNIGQNAADQNQCYGRSPFVHSIKTAVLDTKKELIEDFVPITTDFSIWQRFFTVAPLIVVGTKEEKGYDLAPKHMATPLGQSNYFGFVCTPRHATYHNIKSSGEFTVSFPKADQVALASLSASPRCEDSVKSEYLIKSLPTIKATSVDALFIAASYLYLECELFKIIDGFDDYSFITGTIKAVFVHPDYVRVSEKDEQLQIMQNPLLAYIAEGRFATISNTYNFPFPKDFKR